MVVRAWYRMLCWAGWHHGRAVLNSRSHRFEVRCRACDRRMPDWRASVPVLSVNAALDREVPRWWARTTGSSDSSIFREEILRGGR